MSDTQHFDTDPQPQPEPPSTYDAVRPRRSRRLLATAGVTAAALVTGLGGVGAGYAIGHRGADTPAAVSGSTTQQAGTDGSGGIVTIPGAGPFGDGGTVVPVEPFTDPRTGSGQSSGSTDTTSKATGSQLTGLVRIVSTMKYDGGEAAGTGMVLTSDGEIVTNHHVVAGATSIKVTVMATGDSYTAKVVGTDTPDDVALLQLSGPSGLDTVTTDTDGIATGDAVTAVGDANGTVGYLSASTGTVVAKDQTITTQSEANAQGETLNGLLQISSDVMSGDSGGATYDEQGDVVGMTTAASSGSADVVGYAVPIAKVLRVVGDLRHGVTSARYDYGYPAFLGIGLSRGTTAATVDGVFQRTPAAQAGIRAGATITGIDGTTITTSAQLLRTMAALSPGDQVRVRWTTADGADRSALVTVTAGPVA